MDGGMLLLIAVVVELAVLVGIVVWAINLSSAVYSIEATLSRMDARQAEQAEHTAVTLATDPQQSAAPSAPIDIEPFVD